MSECLDGRGGRGEKGDEDEDDEDSDEIPSQLVIKMRRGGGKRAPAPERERERERDRRDCGWKEGEAGRNRDTFSVSPISVRAS